MGDALIRIVHVKQGNARSPACGPCLGDERLTTGHQGLVGPPEPGVDDVVHHSKHPGRISNGTPRRREACERRCPGALVQEYPVNRDQGVAVTQIDNDMGVPQFLKQGLRICQS